MRKEFSRDFSFGSMILLRNEQAYDFAGMQGTAMLSDLG